MSEYKVGDLIRYKYTHNFEEYIECPFCGGKGYIEYNGEKLDCYSCESDGVYTIYRTEDRWSAPCEIIGVGVKYVITKEGIEKVPAVFIQHGTNIIAIVESKVKKDAV